MTSMCWALSLVPEDRRGGRGKVPGTQKSEGTQTSIWEPTRSPPVFVQLVPNVHGGDERPGLAGAIRASSEATALGWVGGWLHGRWVWTWHVAAGPLPA